MSIIKSGPYVRCQNMELQLSNMPCLTPFYRKDLAIPVSIPCGKCPECVKRRVSAWSFRLQQEEKVSTSAQFITLTYDTKTIPITSKGYLSLSKRDLQLFFKKLRKANAEKIKYYAVGEYGSKTKRPHYHIILFNAVLDTIQPSWFQGDVHYGTVGGASIGYTLKYISKKKLIPEFESDDRLPEFSLMSKRLGISYITEATKRWHKADLENRMYNTIEDGKKLAMPRYFKEKIYTEIERKVIALRSKAKADLEEQKLIDTQTLGEFQNYEQSKIAAFKAQQKNSIKNDKI